MDKKISESSLRQSDQILIENQIQRFADAPFIDGDEELILSIVCRVLANLATHDLFEVSAIRGWNGQISRRLKLVPPNTRNDSY